MTQNEASALLLPARSPEREIACDESGFCGGNLVGQGHSPVFAHASVLMDPDAAGRVVDRVRRAIGAHGGEVKASELLRPRNRQVVLWLLGPSGPLGHRAHVHLTDTTFFVLARVVEVLLGQAAVSGTECPGRAPATRAMALTLYRWGKRGDGPPGWPPFLTLAGNLLRTNNRWLPKDPVPAFYSAVDALAAAVTASQAREVLQALAGTRQVAETTRAAHIANPRLSPLLEPLIPALAETIEWWGSQHSRVAVVHDEQSALTSGRLEAIRTRYLDRHPTRRLGDIRRVDSRGDARVQVADFLAGVARRVAHDGLVGRPDPELTVLLAPLVSPRSVWVQPES